MRQYEVTIIVDPVLSSDEIKATAENYVEHLKGQNAEILHVDEIGLRQLAYSINKRSTGIYYCIEFKSDQGDIIPTIELALKRDARVMRYLTVKLDKFAVKYNEDRRSGAIKSYKESQEKRSDSKEEVKAEK